MNTIIRDKNGIISVYATVVKTIAHLVDTKPGFYSIEDIQIAVNNQVEPVDCFTKKMIRRAIVQLMEKVEKSNS